MLEQISQKRFSPSTYPKLGGRYCKYLNRNNMKKSDYWDFTQ